MTHLRIAQAIYKHFVDLIDENGSIPVDMQAPSLVGTVQDDPFDRWVAARIAEALPQLEIFRSKPLITPDLLLRDRTDGAVLGIKVKKLIQKPSGADSRGLTLDYNSCVPCGSALIKVGRDSVEAPTFYLFCLLSTDSINIVTLVLMDGDCLNYDFNLHKDSKVANISEYGHGPYGEGSVRRRAMYLYPSPLNRRLPFFHMRKVMVVKEFDAINLGVEGQATDLIHRTDIHGNDLRYLILDSAKQEGAEVVERFDIFAACKARAGRARTPSVSKLPRFTKP
jgi:hypothetical protein